MPTIYTMARRCLISPRLRRTRAQPEALGIAPAIHAAIVARFCNRKMIARTASTNATAFSIAQGEGVPFAALADREGVSRSYFTRLVRLSYLAPDITQAILDGRQPPDLTAEKLLEHSRLPLAWHDQRTVLGFA